MLNLVKSARESMTRIILDYLMVIDCKIFKIFVHFVAHIIVLARSFFAVIAAAGPAAVFTRKRDL